VIERSTMFSSDSRVCSSIVDAILIALPSMMKSNWKSTAHTTFGASAWIGRIKDTPARLRRLRTGLTSAWDVMNGFVNETGRNGRWRGTRRDGLDGRLVVTCTFETCKATRDDDRLAHHPELADPCLVLATGGNVSGGLRPWRLSCRS
jgi:hypothetical protein